MCFVFLWVPACAGTTREFAGMTRECAGISGVTLTLALSHRGRGDDGMEMETRKKPGAVFGPVFVRERSWICASAAKRQRRS